MIMKQKPIIIWWGVNTSYSFLEEGLRAEEPVPILKKFLTECATTDVKKKGYINPSGQVGSASDLAHCPAIIDELKNVYGIKSYYDYKLNIDSQNAISTEDYGQDFFNKHITVRSERLLSFKQGWLFFAPYEKKNISPISIPPVSVELMFLSCRGPKAVSNSEIYQSPLKFFLPAFCRISAPIIFLDHPRS